MEFVCKDCFSDTELIGFIVSQNNINQCDCCKKSNIEVIRIDELYAFFTELLTNLEPKAGGNFVIEIASEGLEFLSKSSMCR